MPHRLNRFLSSAPAVKNTVLKLEWNITVRRSSRRRTLEIRVNRDGVRVLCPIDVTDDAIKFFVESRRNWIKSKLEIIATDQRIQKKIHDSKTHCFYRGRSIGVAEILGLKSGVSLQQNSLAMKILDDQGGFVIAQLHNWLWEQAKRRLLKRTQYFANHMELLPELVEVKKYKSMWGRCNSKGEIAFDWRIIQAPDDVLDYLVVHELSHLKHFNHSKEFWALVFSILPDFRKSKSWLRRSEHILRLI